jgi:hypothetical protein
MKTILLSSDDFLWDNDGVTGYYRLWLSPEEKVVFKNSGFTIQSVKTGVKHLFTLTRELGSTPVFSHDKFDVYM